MIVRVRVVLRRTVVGYSCSLMFQELHKRKVKSLRQSTSTKLVLCKLIGQFFFGVISCETLKYLIVLTDSFVV